MTWLKTILTIAVISCGMFAFADGRPDVAAAMFALVAALNSMKVAA